MVNLPIALLVLLISITGIVLFFSPYFKRRKKQEAQSTAGLALIAVLLNRASISLLLRKPVVRSEGDKFNCLC